MAWLEAVYRVSRTWPSDERFGLISQVRRASVSIAANIAEGAGRRTTGDFLQFVAIARGSLAEAETLLLIASRLSFTPQEQLAPLLEEARELGSMLSGLAASLKRRQASH
jgi:four helix bundle protein